MGKALVLRQQQLLESVVGKTNGGTTDRCTHCATAALIVLIGALIALTGAHTVLQVHCTGTHCATGALIVLIGAPIVL